MPAYKYRAHVWTWFPPDPPGAEDRGAWDALAEALINRVQRHPKVAYTLFQLEQCPTTNRLHFQGYSETGGAKATIGQLRVAYGDGVHVERRNGTHQQATDYVTKTETKVYGPWEWGVHTPPGPRKRKQRMADALDMVRAGAPDILVAQAQPAVWLQFNRALTRYRGIVTETPRTWKTKVYWYYGGTGVGKTRLAMLMTRARGWIAPDNTGRWFDTYAGEPDVIFDDFSGEDAGHPPRNLFLRLFDRYPMKVPIKGGFVNWAPKRVFITSNGHPGDLYNNDPAVLRRVAEVFLIH